MSPIIPGDLNDWYVLLARIDALEQANKAQTFAVGDLKLSATGVPGSGWLECNGQAVTTTFLNLRNALINAGSPYGSDTSSNPRVPNFTRRVPIGRGGGTALGSLSGEETHLLSASESGVRAHQHTTTIEYTAISLVNQVGTGFNILHTPGLPPANGTPAFPSSTASDANASTAHNNMQPSIGVIVLVKT